MSDSEIIVFLNTGYIEYLKCPFGDPNWDTCFSSGRVMPAAFIAGFWGTVKLLSTQVGFFAEYDVLQDEDDAGNGEQTIT